MIVVLSGTNMFAIQEKLEALKQKFAHKNGSEGIENYSGENIQPEDLASLLTSVSLFTPHRLVILKNISENKAVAERLIEYLDKIPDETSVIIKEGQLDKRTAYYKTLKSLPEFFELNQPTEAELLAWIKERVEREGGTIDNQAVRLLYQQVGLDQLRLSNEIAKLVAYDQKVTSEAILQLVEANPKDTVFQLLEYTLSGDTSRALKILDNLERSFEDPYQTANMLIWQTQVLAVVKSAGERSDSEVAKESKINPYVVQKTRALARKLDRSKLLKIIDSVANLDIRLKSTSVEPWRAIEQTIITL